MKFNLLILSLTMHAGMSYANEVQCIRQDLASIQGLIPGLRASNNLLDNYEAVEAVSGEDDGGEYTGQKYKYEHFEVIIVRDFIDSIRISSPLILWAESIKTGMNRDEIEKNLGYAQVYRGNSSSQYLICSNVGDVYAVLDYSMGYLKSIEIVIDRP